MAKKKSTSTDTKPISFRCPEQLKKDLEDLARLSRSDVSTILTRLCVAFVKANKDRLSTFRKSAHYDLNMPTFSSSKTKEDAAPTDADSDADTGTVADERGGENAED